MTDNTTGYGEDQDREGTTTAPGRDWQEAADRNPDDFDADTEEGTEVNPDTGTEYGSIDSGPGRA
jgi:hypothetical protein